MLTDAEKALFVLLAGVSLTLAWTGFRRVVRVVLRGRRDAWDRTSNLPARLGAGAWRALTQRRMFRDRPVASTFHAFVFYGFVFYLLVNLGDAAQGLLPTSWTGAPAPRVWTGPYRLGTDLASMLVLLGMAYFLLRRFGIGGRRSLPDEDDATPWHERVRARGVQRDSLIVGAFILLHVGSRLAGEGFLLAAEGHVDPWQPFASLVALGAGFGEGRMLGWHLGWWGALGSILAFLPYVPRSKHLHLVAAPANFAFEARDDRGRRVPSGALAPFDLEDEGAETFGAARLEDLAPAQILDAYACIQCRRCTDACPAHATGKALDPAAIEIDQRYELNAHGAALAAGEASPRPLLAFALDEASLWACTTCGACIDACPVGCEPMIDVVEVRRERVLMQGAVPSGLQQAFRGLERQGNPWGLSPEARMDWAEGLDVPTVAERPDFEVLFWVGCAGAYDPGARGTTRAMARILDHAGVNYAVLGKGESCTGDPARRAGNEYLYYELAHRNVEVLNETLIEDTLHAGRPKRVLTTCPHCYNALLNDYPQLGGEYRVVHHTQILDELVAAGRLPPLDLGAGTTYHDPCYLGRHNGEFDAPRSVLAGEGDAPREMPRHRSKSFCCGAGGAQFFKEEEAGRERVSENRFAEARGTGAEVVATGCPFCQSMLSSTPSAREAAAPEVRDVAQLYAERLDALRARLEA